MAQSDSAAVQETPSDSQQSDMLKMMMEMFQSQMAQQNQIITQLREDAEQTRQAAAEREAEFRNLLQQRSGTSRDKAAPVATKDIPKLISSANLNDFARWMQRWLDFCACQHLDRQSGETRLAALRSCLDDDLLRYIEQGVIKFDVPMGEVLGDTHFIAGLKAYIRSQQNPLLDRIKFFKRYQQTGESFDEFLTSLKELYVACDFSFDDSCVKCKENDTELLRDRVVIGISDDATRHKLLAVQGLTLEDTVRIVRAEEAAHVTKTDIKQTQVNAIRKPSTYKQNQKPQASPKAKSDTCRRCGRADYKDHKCPAKDKTCNKCGKLGHFAVVCRSAAAPNKDEPKSKVGRVQIARHIVPEPRIPIQTVIAGQSIQIKWRDDTGSDLDVIGLRELKRVGLTSRDLAQPVESVHTADGRSMQVAGHIRLTLSLSDKKVDSEVLVIKGVVDPLLSKSSLIALGFLPKDWPHHENGPLRKEIRRTSVDVQEDPSDTQIELDKRKLIEEFADVFDDTRLQVMDTEPVEIPLQPNAVPFRITAARQIPFAYREQIKVQLDEMVEQEIIEPVTEPSEWCHPIVVVDKKGTTEKRMTVDLRKLNDQVKRNLHPNKCPKEAISNIPSSKYFSTMDATKGYWQVPLTQDSRKLTTFITPWGRYRFLRNTMGYLSAGDEFNLRMDRAFEGVPNCEKVVDDCLIHDGTYEDHLRSVRKVLQKCREHRITMSKKKFQFAKSNVNFCGYTISREGWGVDQKKVEALQKFPTPGNRTDLRSFFGLVQQFSEFSKRVAELAQPLRPLLKEGNSFAWDTEHQEAFTKVCEELSKPPMLAFFDPTAEVKLETDAARLGGLGFALYQKDSGKWKLLQCGSRFLTDTESRYAMIELELLAVVWALKKCRVFLIGRSFELIIDHRPLVPILNSYALNQVENPRLLRLLMKTRRFVFHTSWKKGKDNKVADALSRAPVSKPESDELHGEMGKSVMRIATMCDEQIINSLHAQELKTHAQQDSIYQQLVSQIEKGFPARKEDLPSTLMPYWKFSHNLTTENGIVFLGCRIVVPKTLRPRVLADLHASHQGIVRTKRRARQIVFWTSMNNDIENIVASCEQCIKYLPSQPKEPLINIDVPKLPFQSVSSDLFSCGGNEYLILTDRTSNWTCVSKIGRSATTDDVTKALRSWFSDLGVPQTLTTDGGPQYSSRAFKKFCQTWCIDHKMSSPYYAQSNGSAESAVKSTKQLLKKCMTQRGLDHDAFHRGLLELRNTPNTSGRSPAEVLFGRPLGSFVFASVKSFDQKWRVKAEEAELKADELRQKAKERYDRGAKDLSALKVKGHVDMQNPITKMWDKVGVIVAIGRNRDYLVKTGSGRVYWRNRRFLRPHRPSFPCFGGLGAGTVQSLADNAPEAQPQSPPEHNSCVPQQCDQNRQMDPVPPKRRNPTERKSTPFAADRDDCRTDGTPSDTDSALADSRCHSLAQHTDGLNFEGACVMMNHFSKCFNVNTNYSR